MAFFPLRFLILILITSLIPTFSSANSKEKIIWFTWDLPPEFVKMGPWKDKGYADKFLAYFKDNLPEYKHETQTVNIPRWSREVLRPNRCTVHLWGGFFPDELLLSKPYSFTPPQVAIFHKRHEKRLGPKGSILSLEELLKQTDLRLMLVPINVGEDAAQSRYPVLHPYLEPYIGAPHMIEHNSTTNIVSLELLNRGRADYTLGYPSTITAQKRVDDLKGDYISYHLKEHNLYKNVYVACRNTSFGQKIIQKINSILTKDTLKTFLSYHEEWNEKDPNFRAATIDYFINNIKLPNVIE